MKKKKYSKLIISILLIIIVLFLDSRTGKSELKCYITSEEMYALLDSGMPSGGQVDENLKMWTGVVMDYRADGSVGPVIYNQEQFNKWVAAGGNPADAGLSGYSSSSASSKPAAPACNHEYEVKQTKAPNCIEEGENTYTCKLCGDTYTETIPVNGVHNYSSEETTKATCTEPGIVTYTCVYCGDTYTEEVEALGHSYKSEQTKAPTCTEEGEITYTCERCGDSYTEPIPALGHTPSEWQVTKEASLFFPGEQIKTCNVCGEILETEIIVSRFPTWSLYVGIGVLVVLITILFIFIKKKIRKRK